MAVRLVHIFFLYKMPPLIPRQSVKDVLFEGVPIGNSWVIEISSCIVMHPKFFHYAARPLILRRRERNYFFEA